VNEQTRLARPDHAVAFTAADFQHMIESGVFEDMRVELVRGELEKMMPANLAHGELNALLSGTLLPAVRAAGYRIATDLAVRIDEMTVRGIDVAVVRKDTPARGLTGGEHVLLAVEIAETTLVRDLGEKREEYAAIGIPIYWVVDSVRQVTHCFRLAKGGSYGPATVVPFGEPLALPEIDTAITLA
jgi:Uma2 family endonuclease